MRVYSGDDDFRMAKIFKVSQFVEDEVNLNEAFSKQITHQTFFNAIKKQTMSEEDEKDE